MRTKATPKPPPGSVESIRRKTEELESATALLKEARPIIERFEGELAAPNTPTDLPRAMDTLNNVHLLIRAAQMAARDIEGSDAAPMVELLGVILGQLEYAIKKVDGAWRAAQ